MMYERIKKLAKAEGIPIYKLEKELGIAQGALCKIDKHEPSYERVVRIAERLHTTPEYLLVGDESPNYYLNEETARIAEEVFNNPDLKILFNAARDCSPEDMKKVITIIQTIKGDI